jgi:hypothetical protein
MLARARGPYRPSVRHHAVRGEVHRPGFFEEWMSMSLAKYRQSLIDAIPGLDTVPGEDHLDEAVTVLGIIERIDTMVGA